MKTKYLKLYYKWMETGKLPGDSGLCKALELSGVGPETIKQYIDPGAYVEFAHWWAWPEGDFDTVRQNMLLLIAAENGEL